MYSAQWQMTQKGQVILSYDDEAEQSTFDGSVILGSLLLGAGISNISDWLKEFSMKRATGIRKRELLGRQFR